jgi:hypothetical protein
MALPTSAAYEVNEASAHLWAEKLHLFAGMQQKGLTMTIGPGALFCTAETIRQMPPDLEVDDATTEHARETATRLLERCAVATPCSISAVSIDQFEHDILIRWQLNGKGLILTCPGEPQAAPSLYREQIENDRAVNPEMLSNPSPEDLAKCMKWMLFSE